MRYRRLKAVWSRSTCSVSALSTSLAMASSVDAPNPCPVYEMTVNSASSCLPMTDVAASYTSRVSRTRCASEELSGAFSFSPAGCCWK